MPMLPLQSRKNVDLGTGLYPSKRGGGGGKIGGGKGKGKRGREGKGEENIEKQRMCLQI